MSKSRNAERSGSNDFGGTRVKCSGSCSAEAFRYWQTIITFHEQSRAIYSFLCAAFRDYSIFTVAQEGSFATVICRIYNLQNPNPRKHNNYRRFFFNKEFMSSIYSTIFTTYKANYRYFLSSTSFNYVISISCIFLIDFSSAYRTFFQMNYTNPALI